MSTFKVKVTEVRTTWVDTDAFTEDEGDDVSEEDALILFEEQLMDGEAEFSDFDFVSAVVVRFED